MTRTRIQTDGIADGAVTAAAISAQAITTEKLSSDIVIDCGVLVPENVTSKMSLWKAETILPVYHWSN